MANPSAERPSNMPADYKYEFITVGQPKALEKAKDELWAIHRQLSEAKVLDPKIVARLRGAWLLLSRATANPLAPDDYDLLKELLGPDFGEEYKT